MVMIMASCSVRFRPSVTRVREDQELLLLNDIFFPIPYTPWQPDTPDEPLYFSEEPEREVRLLPIHFVGGYNVVSAQPDCFARFSHVTSTLIGAYYGSELFGSAMDVNIRIFFRGGRVQRAYLHGERAIFLYACSPLRSVLADWPSRTMIVDVDTHTHTWTMEEVDGIYPMATRYFVYNQDAPAWRRFEYGDYVDPEWRWFIPLTAVTPERMTYGNDTVVLWRERGSDIHVAHLPSEKIITVTPIVRGNSREVNIRWAASNIVYGVLYVHFRTMDNRMFTAPIADVDQLWMPHPETTGERKVTCQRCCKAFKRRSHG